MSVHVPPLLGTVHRCCVPLWPAQEHEETKHKIKTGAQVGPNLPGKKRRCPLTHSASLVFSVFRETRWAEDGGRMYVVQVVEGTENVVTAAGESGENMEMQWGAHF